MVASEEKFSLYLQSMDLLKILNCIQSDDFQYYAQVINHIFELDMLLENKIKEIDGNQPEELQIKDFYNLLSAINLPGTMLKDNWGNDGDYSMQRANRVLLQLVVDIFFYMISAWDVVYTQNYIKDENGERPIFMKFLPFYDGDNLKNPSRLWFDHLQEINGFETEHEFATAIPLLGLPPRKIDPISQKRMLRKWKVGKTNQLPSWENIYSITEVLAKKRKLNMDDLDYYKSQALLAYSHLKIFQILLNRLMTDECRDEFRMDAFEVVESFERYLYWYNYHSVMFMENGH